MGVVGQKSIEVHVALGSTEHLKYLFTPDTIHAGVQGAFVSSHNVRLLRGRSCEYSLGQTLDYILVI